MTDHRKSTVREVLSSNLLKKQRVIVGKLRGRYLFRATIRLVIEYKEWIGDYLDDIGDDVNVNVKLAQRKNKSKEEPFTLKDRSILLIKPDKRTRDEVAYIETFIRNIKAFKKYPEYVRELIASEVGYQYFPAGKTIIRQNHKPLLLYFIIRGQLQIIKDVTDDVTGEVTQIEAGVLQPGDIFGEIALLHKVPRTATVVSKTSVDLLVITKRSFNTHLRSVLLEEWDVLRDALLNFNYFKGWSEETMRECCILSKIMNYRPHEILLGDGKGMVHYVYFLLSGECRVIEHLLVEKRKSKIGKENVYKLYSPKKQQKEEPAIRKRVSKSDIVQLTDDHIISLITSDDDKEEADKSQKEDVSADAEDFIKLIAEKKTRNIAMERISVVTVTLQDIINQWHEITDIVELLMREPSVSSLDNYPDNVQTIFMQVCMFYRGACFGLGENLKNRRVVANTPVRCLLIPRYWLTQHNRANIWERVKNFMNSKFPTPQDMLKTFVENRKWAKYKKDYAESILDRGRRIPVSTKYYDVPYSIRINEIHQ